MSEKDIDENEESTEEQQTDKRTEILEEVSEIAADTATAKTSLEREREFINSDIVFTGD